MALPVDEQRQALLPAYRAVYGAYGVDWDLNTAALADDYVGTGEGTRVMVDIPTEWHGREGYLAVHATLREVLHIARVELDDVIPLGDNRVVALTRFVLVAGGGEIEQQLLDYHEFRDGQCVRQRIWFDREEGLRDLGLS